MLSAAKIGIAGASKVTSRNRFVIDGIAKRMINAGNEIVFEKSPNAPQNGNIVNEI